MIGLVAGFALPVSAAWLWLRAWPLRGSPDFAPLTAALAFGVGVGLSSLTPMWWVARGLSLGPAFVAADALLWVSLAAVALRRLFRTSVPGDLASPLDAPQTVLRVVRGAFALVAVMAVGIVAREYLAAPHGQWDAWAIWNQKARFLLRGGEEWTALLGVEFANPSHPLLLPAVVARLWAYAGEELTIAPALAAGGFGAATVAAVMGRLDVRQPRAWLAGAVLLAPPMYAQQIISQQADVPVGFFMVATLALIPEDPLALWRHALRAARTLLLVGLLAGCAAWTKNEGMVFLVAMALLASWATLRHGRGRQLLWCAVGAAPVLLTLLWFKLVVSPGAPLYLEGTPGPVGLLQWMFDLERHRTVLRLMWAPLLQWGGPLARGVVPVGIVAAVVVLCVPAARRARTSSLAVLFMLASYHLVFVLSSLEPETLVPGTVPRLVSQLWPALVLAVFSGVRDPREG